jgi:hypothetical protein
MIIYEITAVVREDLTEKYEKYMRERHIPDLLATGFFRGAKFARAGPRRYRIQYEASSAEALEEYLKSDAPRLRADFAGHFPEGAALTRENWEVLEAWRTDF